MAAPTVTTAPAEPNPAVLVAANLVVLGLVVAGFGLPVLLLALLVPAAVVVATRPQRGLLLLAALVPFDGLLLLVDLPGAARGWKEALVLLTVAATATAPPSARGARGRRLPTWVPAVAGLLALGLVSAVLVGGVQAVVGLKVTFFYLLVGVAAWRCPLDAGERDRLVTVLMASGVVVAAYGVLQQLIGPAALNALGYEWNTTIRYTGSFLRSWSTFNQPFGLAFYLMAVVLVGLPVALAERGRLRNQLFLLALPLLAAGMATTFVRASWIGVAVGLAYLGASRYRILLLVIPAGVVALLLLPGDVASSALSSSSSAERLDHWTTHLDTVVSNPVGIGIGGTGSAAERAAELTGGGPTYQPDNYYYKVAYELGPLGLWMLVLLLGAAFAATRRSARTRAGPDGALALGVSANIAAAAVASLAATYFEIFPLDVLFWLLLTVVATCEHGSD